MTDDAEVFAAPKPEPHTHTHQPRLQTTQPGKEVKVRGYLNAAREGLRNARFYVEVDNPAHELITKLIDQVYTTEEVYERERH